MAVILLSYRAQRRNIFIERSINGCDGDTVSTPSADVDHDIGILYLGLGNRYVLGYALSDIVTAKAKA